MKPSSFALTVVLAGLMPGLGRAADSPPAAPPFAGHFGPAIGFAFGVPLAAELELTAEQREAFRALRHDFEDALAPLLEHERERIQEVRTLLDRDDPDPYEVGKLTIEAHQGRLRIEALHVALREKLRSLLDAEQLERWQELESRRAERGSLVREGLSFRQE